MAKVLVTGSAGFIGMHLCKMLTKKNEVVGLDDLNQFSNHALKLLRLNVLRQSALAKDVYPSSLSLHEIDITNTDKLNQLFAKEQFDAVIHLAALTGVRQSIKNPLLYQEVNVNGFLNILEACKKYNVSKLLYASSSSVYGGNIETPFKETASIENLLNYYAVTKRMNELAAENYANLYGINAIGMRFFTVYGPWTRPDMATYTFIKNIMKGEGIQLYNQGNLLRDFTYIDDVITAIILLLTKLFEHSEIRRHDLFNIGAGQPILVKDFVSILEEYLGKKANIEFATKNNEEMLCTFANCDKLFNYIGFKPNTSVHDGLKRTVDWYLDNNSTR
jgi:UDP-glucuronate 4-epimerase